jgi:hypothetical protein
MHGEVRTAEKVAMAYFKIKLWHLPRETKEGHEILSQHNQKWYSNT